MGLFDEFFKDIQPDPDERQLKFRDRIHTLEHGAARVLSRRQMPNKFWGFWRDKAMTQTYTTKREYLNVSHYDRAIKSMLQDHPDFDQGQIGHLPRSQFEPERICPKQ